MTIIRAYMPFLHSDNGFCGADIAIWGDDMIFNDGNIGIWVVAN